MMMEKADDMRAGAMAVALRQSEISLGLNFRENESLGHRVDAILAAAQNVRLEPRLYAIAWFVRTTLSARKGNAHA